MLQSCGWIELHLGTVVDIAGHAEDASDARAVIGAAFSEIALIHRLMSFHDEDSDVSRMNREAARRPNRFARPRTKAARRPVQVDRRTMQVLSAARTLSRQSGGLFDVTVAPDLVAAGLMPRPAAACKPAADACWRDIELLSDDRVFFRKPLWLDLGGIAKGYAVDRAFQICAGGAVADYLINAGGDLRLSKGVTASITLDAPTGDGGAVPRVELTGGGIASSCGRPHARSHAGMLTGPHVDGVTRAGVDPLRFAAVLAQECMVADALTKVVLILGRDSLPILVQHGATALVCDPHGGWEQIPAGSHVAGGSPVAPAPHS